MSRGNSAIDGLRLDDAFAHETHRPFDQCWTVRMDSRLLVVDDDELKCSRFSDDEADEPRALLVINDRNREIILLSIDNSLVSSLKGGIADCALFDTDQFRFVEFKTNAYGNSEEAVRDTFDKAVSQLKATYGLFDRKLQKVHIKFSEQRHISCHIVTSRRFPRATAVKQEYRLSFADETGLALSFEDKIFWNSPSEKQDR